MYIFEKKKFLFVCVFLGLGFVIVCININLERLFIL